MHEKLRDCQRDVTNRAVANGAAKFSTVRCALRLATHEEIRSMRRFALLPRRP